MPYYDDSKTDNLVVYSTLYYINKSYSNIAEIQPMTSNNDVEITYNFSVVQYFKLTSSKRINFSNHCAFLAHPNFHSGELVQILTFSFHE